VSTLSEINEAINQSYIAYQSTYDGELPFRDYYNFVITWHIHPVKHKEKIVGAVFTKDSNVHVAVNGTWFPRRYIKNIILPMLDTYGVVNTTVDLFNEAGLAWVMKLGFKLIDKNYKQYKLVLKKDDLCLSLATL
jgi:hypothetical protein